MHHMPQERFAFGCEETMEEDSKSKAILRVRENVQSATGIIVRPTRSKTDSIRTSFLLITKMSRIERAKNGLEECKDSLQKIVPIWDSLSEAWKSQTIGSICIYIHFCDAFTVITQEFVENIFRENGGWKADHPFTMGVVERLREWRVIYS